MTKKTLVGLLFSTLLATPLANAEVYELRTYVAAEGKFDALLTRFEDHTLRIFENHGIHNIAYWVPQDEPDASTTLIYVVSHDSREQAQQNWQAFLTDPEWQQVAEESQRDGALLSGPPQSVFMDITDWSPSL